MASRISRKRLQLVTVLCALLLSAATAPSARQPAAEGTNRVVAIGDIHGDFDAFVSILREAGLVDAEHRWIGGAAMLVQTGDFTDRDPEARAVMDLLMTLEEHAESAIVDHIGEALRARTPGGQEAEALLACNVLNRMTELGRPVSYSVGR